MKLKGFFKVLMLSLISINAFSQRYAGFVAGIPDSPDRPHMVTSISTTHNSNVIEGKYLTILGTDNSTITNPFIIVEGFDFLNNQSFEDYLRLYNAGNILNADFYRNSLIYSLHNANYDVIILDFDNSTDWIQNNAMLLVELINSLNLTKDNLVVMGYSMGGLVARYALTWMESQGQNHHTRLYISHDAPHKGANFPLGLQELIEDISYNTALLWIPAQILLMSFEYNVPAARQMLVYYYADSRNGVARPSEDKISLFDEMYNMNPEGNGYPSIPVKIAISNGNYSGIPQYNPSAGRNLSAGDEILYFDYRKGNGESCTCNIFYYIWHGRCDQHCTPWAEDQLTATVRAGFDGSRPLEEFFFYHMGKHDIGNTGIRVLPFGFGGSGRQFFHSNNYAYDIASGSISPHFITSLEGSIRETLTTDVRVVPTTCFIPTISALDLNIGLSEPFDLSHFLCKTSFDHIHANASTNDDHFALTLGAKYFILQHVLTHGMPIRRFVYDDINIEISNKTINSGEHYNRTAVNTITSVGSFAVESGGSSTLTSGNSIILKPGFSVENGGVFSASAISNGAWCPSPVEFRPHHITNLPIPKSNQEHIILSYDCSNYEDLPSYSPDSLYFDCHDFTIPTKEQMDSLLDENIIIYPNPTTGAITIEFSPEIILEHVKIKIYHYMGNLIYSLNNVTSNTLSINLSNAMTGLLMVEFNFNNGSYIYTKRILKQ